MKKLVIVLIGVLLLLASVSCARTPESVPAPTTAPAPVSPPGINIPPPTATPTPPPTTAPMPTLSPAPSMDMPSDKYRFTPPYSAKFDLESSKGFDITKTGAEFPSYKWSDTLEKEYPILKKYAELPQTERICLLPQGNSAIATFVLTSTFDDEFDISIKVRVGEWLAYDKVPKGIHVVPSSDVIHLKPGGRTSLNLEVDKDTPSGLYYVDVFAAIEGYRQEAVLWLLVSSY